MSRFEPELTANGRIPAHTECPFRKSCIFAESSITNEVLCKHKGIEHDTEFSCATARALKSLDKETITTLKWSK